MISHSVSASVCLSSVPVFSNAYPGNSGVGGGSVFSSRVAKGAIALVVVAVLAAVVVVNRHTLHQMHARLRNGCLLWGSSCALSASTAPPGSTLSPSAVHCNIKGRPGVCDVRNLAYSGGKFIVHSPSLQGVPPEDTGAAFAFRSLVPNAASQDTFRHLPTEVTDAPVSCDVFVDVVPMFYCSYFPRDKSPKVLDGQSPRFLTALADLGFTYDEGTGVWGPGTVTPVALPDCYPLLGRRSGYNLGPKYTWTVRPRAMVDGLPSSTTTYCFPRAVFNAQDQSAFLDAPDTQLLAPPPTPAQPRKFLVRVVCYSSCASFTRPYPFVPPPLSFPGGRHILQLLGVDRSGTRQPQLAERPHRHSSRRRQLRRPHRGAGSRTGLQRHFTTDARRLDSGLELRVQAVP